MTSVLIAICTYKRPESLSRCLESLYKMRIPSKVFLEIVVIDNEPSDAVYLICRHYGIEYVSEPQRGLVFARNKVLEYARNHKPDFLGIIDDDETVSSEWLKDMLSAFAKTNADALSGVIDIKLGQDMPSYLKKAYQFKKVTLITAVTTMPMGNIMFRRTVLEIDIWFDKRFNTTGGEDIDFCSRLSRLGKKLFKIPNAVVTEYLMPEKASLKAFFYRQMRVAKLHYSHKYPKLSVSFFGECILSAFEFAGALLCIPLCFFNDSMKVKMIKLSAKATGRILSRYNKPIQAYGG